MLLSRTVTACAVPILLAQGCTIATLRHLVRRRLAVMERVYLPSPRRSQTIIRLHITDAGRKALAGYKEKPRGSGVAIV
jgi:hypothetical protein